MAAHRNSARGLVTSLLGDAALGASVGELKRSIAATSTHSRERLKAHLRESVESPSQITEEKDRVLVARVTVALLPESVDLVRDLLRETEAVGPLGELQFSVFVALSDLFDGSNGGSMQEDLLSDVEAYLIQVESDETQAAWMAGDLLGDHWPLHASLPVLLRVATAANHSVGREGALHGLSHALSRASKREQWLIMETLNKVAKTDSSSAVRSYAASIAGDMRGL